MMHTVLDYEAIAVRYRRMRAISFGLNKILCDYVSKEGMESTSKKLGIWRKGILVFDDEDQAAVLFDQAIHGYFANGRNAVDDYLADHPPQPDSDQQAMLAAIQQSFYSLFRVEKIVPQVGVHVEDILRECRHFMADVGFSQSAVKGLVLATRVLPFENFIMTGGAALPVDAGTLVNIVRLPALNRLWQDIEAMPKQKLADVTAEIIRLCLKGNSSQAISYGRGAEAAQEDGIPEAGQPRVGRNDPCPCGSGRKYKKCCGR